MRLCPWSLASRGSVLGLASKFFCALSLGLEPCVLDSTTGKDTVKNFAFFFVMAVLKTYISSYNFCKNFSFLADVVFKIFSIEVAFATKPQC